MCSTGGQKRPQTSQVSRSQNLLGNLFKKNDGEFKSRIGFGQNNIQEQIDRFIRPKTSVEDGVVKKVNYNSNQIRPEIMRSDLNK